MVGDGVGGNGGCREATYRQIVSESELHRSCSNFDDSTAQSDAEFTSERSSRAFHAPAEKGAVGREEVALDLVDWAVAAWVRAAAVKAAAARGVETMVWGWLSATELERWWESTSGR